MDAKAMQLCGDPVMLANLFLLARKEWLVWLKTKTTPPIDSTVEFAAVRILQKTKAPLKVHVV